MTEWDQRAGLGRHMPLWFAFLFFALISFTFAVSEHMYVTDYDAAGGKHPPIADQQQARMIRRSVFAKVAEWGYPKLGKWGCVAVFAVPGAAFLGAAWWLRRKRL